MPVLGPEELSYADQAAIVSEVIGREVRYEHQTWDAYKEAAMARGLTDASVQSFVDMLRAKEEGMDNQAPRDTAIIGPISYRQWVEEELQPALAG